MRKVTKPKEYESPETLGQRISFERREKNISQEELANTLLIKRELLNMIENDSRVPKVEVLIDISKNLGVSTDYLLGLSAYKNQNEVEELIKKVHALDGLDTKQKSKLIWSLGFASESLKNVTDGELKATIVSWLSMLLQNFGRMVYLPEKLELNIITLRSVTSPHKEAIDLLNKLDEAIMDKLCDQHIHNNNEGGNSDAT